jgi:hypothetical protein
LVLFSKRCKDNTASPQLKQAKAEGCRKTVEVE